MATTSAIDLLIETSKSASNLKEIKQLSKEIKTAMLEMGDDGGEEFDKLARAAADLEDRVGEVKDRIDQMNPDKFSAIESAAKIGATGINLVTGAMGLLGDQSEDTQRALLKVQQAMAFAQGLSGIKDLEKDFQNLWKAISKNPLGMFAAALGVVIAALAILNQWLIKDTEEVKNLEKALEAQQKATQRLSVDTEAHITVLEAQGEQEEKIFELKKKLLEQQIQEMKIAAELHLAKVRQVIDNDDLYESYIRAAKGAAELIGADETAAEMDKLLQQSKKERAEEDVKAAQDSIDKVKQLSADLTALQINEEQRVAESAKRAREQEVKSQQDHDAHRLQLHNEYLQKKREAEDAEIARRKEQLAQAQADEAAWLQAQIDAQAELDKALEGADANLEERLAMRHAAQMEFANAAVGMFSALEGLTKKGSAANKALALADIAAGTAVGFINALDIAQKSAKATGPAAAFAFPIFYASQVAAVLAAAARARDVLRGGNASGGGGSIGGGGGAFTAPNIAAINTEPAGTQPTTPIDANGNPIQTNNQPQGPQQVFVVETDITRATGRVAVLENNLTLR